MSPMPAILAALGFRPTPDEYHIRGCGLDVVLDVNDYLISIGARAGGRRHIYVYQHDNDPDWLSVSHPLLTNGPIRFYRREMEATLRPIMEMYAINWPESIPDDAVWTDPYSFGTLVHSRELVTTGGES